MSKNDNFKVFFDKNELFQRKTLTIHIYIYIIDTINCAKRTKEKERQKMRIILDTDQKTITVPWNYQEKLEAYNKMVMEISGDEKKTKTFTSFIDEIWNDCIKHSDKCVKTGKKPEKKDK